MTQLGSRAYKDWMAFVTPSRRERSLAIATATVMIAIVVIVAPSGRVSVGEIPAFLPAFGALTIFAMALITQILCAQYVSSRFPPFGFLALAYAVQTVLTTTYLLTFPRTFSPLGLLGAGSQTAPYLYLSWHLAFFVLVGAYATCTAGLTARKNSLSDAGRGLLTTTIATAVIGVVVAIVAMRYSDLLPTIVTNGRGLTPIWTRVMAPLTLVCNVTVLAILFRVSGFRTVVDMWLGVALLGFLCEGLLATTFSGGRFTVGWYFARVEWLVASLVFLVVKINKMNAIISRLATANEQLEIDSGTDALTGLGNRRAFEARFRSGVAHAIREIEPYSLLSIDVDEFKRYNDTFGHPQGDVALRLVSEAISRVLSPALDFAARLGGEEFAVALPNTQRAGACLMAEAIHDSLAALNVAQYDGCPTGRLTVSIGVASTEDERGGDSASLLTRADQALYAAKRGGRNRTQVAA